jgi:outer membrane protein TolC
MLALALIVAGCGAVDRSLQQRVAAEAVNLEPAVEDDDRVLQAGSEAAAGRLPDVEAFAVPENADLATYVAFSLERNPSIHRAIRRVQAMGYRVPQVTSLEDPMITLLPPTGDLVETAAGMMDAQIGVSQKIPFPGRLTRRGRLAEQEVRMALATLTDVRIRTVADVARAYYEYYLADVSIDITRESERLLEQIRAVASARYRAGTATQPDVLRAEVELYALTNELITLEQRRVTAQARLNTLMNRPVEALLPPPRAFDLEAVDWKLPAAMDRAVESNPQLVRLREQIKRDLEAIRLARLDYFPDLRVGFSYTFIGSGISPVATGSDNWGLPLGLNLPIWWQRLRAGVLEANARTLTSVEQFEEARNTILFGLQDTLVKVDTQYRQAVLFRDLLVPRARQTVEVSTAAYQAGDLEFTAFIDNWRNWLNYSLAYHQALAGLEQRFADLQQLIGVRIPRDPSTDHVDGNTAEEDSPNGTSTEGSKEQ